MRDVPPLLARAATRMLLSAVVALIAAAIASPAQAANYFASSPTELQDAITTAAATDGNDTITLAAGTFHIGSSIGTVTLRAFNSAVPSGQNAITLVGTGPGATILDGDGVLGTVVDVSGSSAMAIRNLTIRNSGGDGVDAFRQGVTLSDVVIRDNAGDAVSGGDITISGSTITNNAQGIYAECGIIATNTTI